MLNLLVICLEIQNMDNFTVKSHYITHYGDCQQVEYF